MQKVHFRLTSVTQKCCCLSSLWLCKRKFFPNSARSHWLFWGHTFPAKTFLSEQHGNNELTVHKCWPIVEIYYLYFVIYNKSLNEQSLGETSYILLPKVPPRDILSFLGNKDSCFPWEALPLLHFPPLLLQTKKKTPKINVLAWSDLADWFDAS